MRTAIVTSSYPSRPGDPAGHFVRTEALSLVQQGDDVHVVAPMGPAGTLTTDPGIRTWPIAHGGAFGWPGAASRIVTRPWRLAGAAVFSGLATEQLKRIRPHRIIAHWLVPCAHPIASLCLCTNDVEAVAHGADVRLLLALPATARCHIVTKLLASTRRIRFVANATFEALSDALPPSLRVSLAQHHVVQIVALSIPDVRSTAERVRRVCGQRPLAVTVGRLVESKRVELAIGAAQHVHPEFALGVIGQGPERVRLQQLAGASVRFPGLVSRDEALGWIAAADVLVHTSIAEAAPTVIREARLLGTPVVACDAGDVAVWAQSDPGIDVVAPEIGAIANAMGRALRSPHAHPPKHAAAQLVARHTIS